MITTRGFKGLIGGTFSFRADSSTVQGNPACCWHRQPANITEAFRGSRRMRLDAQQRTFSKDATSGEVWALDFDGVACDSCGESSLSAWKAAAELWPEVFNSTSALEKKDAVVADMRRVRPVVETGYENIVQIRCLLEGVSPDDMLENWGTMLPEYMSTWGLDRSDLVERFGRTRDEWIQNDLEGWLAPNRIYSGVPEVMNKLIADQHEVYIVTTKQARFTEMILRQMAGIEFPPDRIFSQTTSGRPKSEVLEMLQERHPDTRYHFVEDKFSTLEKVIACPSLEDWNLYLVDWGYNTRPERDAASKNSRIQLIDIGKMSRLAGL